MEFMAPACNGQMVMAVNQVIATMQRDGSLKRLKEKWSVP